MAVCIMCAQAEHVFIKYTRDAHIHKHTYNIIYFYIANPYTFLQKQTNIKMNNTNTIVHPGVCCKTTEVTLRPGTRQFEGMCYVRLGIIMLNICKQSNYKWQNNHLLMSS